MQAKPLHPLITVMRQWPEMDWQADKFKFITGLYYIALVRGIHDGKFRYGRNSYDFQKETLIFMSPGQVAAYTQERIKLESTGWSPCRQITQQFSFFRYEVNEALHISEKEINHLNGLPTWSSFKIFLKFISTRKLILNTENS